MVVVAAINVGASGPRIDFVKYNGAVYQLNAKDRIKISRGVTEQSGFIGALKDGLSGRDYDIVSIGAAGPVKDGPDRFAAVSSFLTKVCDVSNMRCHIDQAEVEHELGKKTFLCNDMPPMIAGADIVRQLEPDSTFVVQEGLEIKPTGGRIVVAPGTGLGYGHSLSNGQIELIGPSEGGHDPYASSNSKPTTEIEELLFAYMKHKYPDTELITQEMVLKGEGIVDILEFLRDVTCHKTDFRITPATPKLILELLKQDDIPDGVEKYLSSPETDKGAYISLVANGKGVMHCVVAQALWERLLGLYVGHKLQTDMPTRGAFLGGTPINKLGNRLVEKKPNLEPFTFMGGLHTRENDSYRRLVDEYPIYGQLDDRGFAYGLARLALTKFEHISSGYVSSVNDIPVEVV